LRRKAGYEPENGTFLAQATKENPGQIGNIGQEKTGHEGRFS